MYICVFGEKLLSKTVRPPICAIKIRNQTTALNTLLATSYFYILSPVLNTVSSLC